jgi:hypothetical protein
MAIVESMKMNLAFGTPDTIGDKRIDGKPIFRNILTPA